MNVTCPNCATVFRVDPAKVPEAGVRARCSVCSAVFGVHREGRQPSRPTPPPTGRRRALPRRRRHPLRPPRRLRPRLRYRRIAAGAGAASTGCARSGRPQPGPPSGRVARRASRAAGRRPSVAPRVEPPRAEPPRPAAPGVPPRPSAPPAVAGGPPQCPAPRPRLPPPRLRRPPPSPVPAHTAAGSHTAAAPVAGRPVNPFLSQDPAQKARRLARALVSDIVVYHPAKRQEGLRDGTLKELFEDEIRKSYEEYTDQVGRDLAESTGYFREALNEILAGGRQLF